MRIIGGEFSSRTIQTPKGQSTRPTLDAVREMIFNSLQRRVDGARFLDLFAGSGAMGIEALSRGATHATFVDSHPAALRCIRSNLKSLGIESAKAQVLPIRALQALKILAKELSPFDLIYLDPPYGEKDPNKQLLTLKCMEEIIRLSLLAEGGIILVEDQHFGEEYETFTPSPLQCYREKKHSSCYVRFYRRESP